MNYQEFRCEFLERMKEVMEEGVSITTEKINKNNGVVMEGLVLKSENARGCFDLLYGRLFFLLGKRSSARTAGSESDVAI